MKPIVEKIKKFDFIHSIILFGSRARGTGGEESDVDICVIPNPGTKLTLKERIELENCSSPNVDISLFDELPINVRERIFQEGKILYTKNLYHVLSLGKETDLEYVRYNEFRKEYHASIMRKVNAEVGV
jgi:predicted nucleotidyltransferase